jgi:ABC-type lipoprotein release transport system permease subunit
VALCGLAGGLALAWMGGRVIRAQLFEVDAHDPRVLAAAVSAVLLVGGMAAWLPARRAARIEPTVALRVE